MALRVHVRVRGGQVTPWVDDEPLAPPTPLADLPTLADLLPKENGLPDIYTLGQPLFRALGDQALLERLDADPDGLLLLETDEASDIVPWEFAALPDRRELLVTRYGLLRLVDRPAPAPPQGNALHFIALAADPLVAPQGHPRTGYRLNFGAELGAIAETLRQSNRAVLAQRIPPTKRHLQRALRRGPAWLHITAHGDIIQTDRGPVAVLLLEDENGRAEKLLGPDLVRLAPRGALRLAVLSACRTAEGADEARLARALVFNGVPAAIGMQGPFPDPASGPLAAALYDSLLAGLDLAEALRQARLALLQETPYAVGLPVAYVARGAWQALAVPEGVPNVAGLRTLGRADLPPEVRPPAAFRGRQRELYDLARLFGEATTRAVTVIGAGGMGKTALAAAFAERFAWRWPQGVLGLSFAAEERPSARAFRAELLRGLLGERQAASLAEAPAGEQEKAILDALRDWHGLLLVDNYETVLQMLEAGEAHPAHAEAEAVHRLLYRVAESTRAQLLLTSRAHPAGLPGERLYPQNRALAGLPEKEAAALFLAHSTRAQSDPQAHAELALQVARATEGHPLAVILLAGEFDTSEAVAPEDFLKGWADELRAARRPGLAAHHVTFAAAVERSYRGLPPALQERLRLLSVFSFPFPAEAAAFVWGLVNEDGEPDADAARPDLLFLHRRSLLEVDTAFPDGRPATFRFLPAVREDLARRATPEERERQQAGYAAYGAWLIDRAYGTILRDLGLARLVRLSLDALDAGFAAQTGLERLWKGWRLAWLQRTFGRVNEALALLQSLWPAAPPDPEQTPEEARAYSRIAHEMAYIYTLRGDLEEAMRLYQESLRIKEALGDQQGKSDTLHEMATIYTLRGDLDTAMRLYQESLRIQEALGDQQGRASTLTMLGQLLVAAGRREEGLNMLKEALAIFRRLGMPRETAWGGEVVAQARSLAVSAPVVVGSRGPAPLQQEHAAQAPEAQPQPDLAAALLEALPEDLRRAVEAALAQAQATGRDLTPDDLPPEARQALEALAQALAHPQRILVEQVKAAVRAVQAGELEPEALLAQLEELAAQIEAREPADSPWREVAQFVRAVVARLKGEPPPPVPRRYADDWAEMW